MSDTPRTDAARLTIHERQRFAASKGVLYELVPADFARQLEREVTRLRAALEAILAAEIIYTGAITETMEKSGMDSVIELVAQARAALKDANG